MNYISCISLIYLLISVQCANFIRQVYVNSKSPVVVAIPLIGSFNIFP